MATKKAADLKRGDGVILAANDHRVVEAVSATEEPVDSNGTTGVRVHWYGREWPNVIAADKELTIY